MNSLSRRRRRLPVGGAAWRRLLAACAALALAGGAAGQDVVLEGLLGTKAVIAIDGARQVMAEGQTVSGVRLDRIEAGYVLVTVAGAQQRVELGSRITGGYVARTQVSARVYQDKHGMYFTLGSINGFPVHMLLDTGATFVALNVPNARRLGVEYRNGQREIVHTASGQTTAYAVKLSSISVGEITINNVDAFVLEGAGPDVPLLGMSFLRKLRVSTDNGVMLLEQSR